MSKMWALIARVVALVAVAVVIAAALLLTSCKASSPAPWSAGNSLSSSSASSSASATDAEAGIGRGASGTVSATSTTPNGTGQDSAAGPLKPFDKLPNPNVPAQRVTSPWPAGKTLPVLTEAPEPTISGLELGSIPEGSRYRVTARPYGIGPEVVFGSRLAIRVDSVKTMGSAPTDTGIAKANLLALVDTAHGGTITKGGTYTATLTFRSDGTKMLPIISAATRVK